MKRMSLDDIILQIIFFAAGIYILIRIFIPILNPASIATNSNYNGNGFYTEILNKANSTIDIASVNENGTSSGIVSVLFTYLTGIDLSNPKTYIASQLPMLQLMDNVTMDQKEQAPVVVVPRDTSKSDDEDDNTGKNSSVSNKQTKKTTTPSGVITTVDPIDEKIDKKSLVTSKPTVLILHTHTTESYNPDDLPNKNFSIDLNTTVAKIGTALSYELENTYGISTIHDLTIHDLPKRLGAYEKSRPTVEKYLKKYPSLKLIVDLHRDGEVNRNSYTATIGKDKYARIMFVAGIKFKDHEKYNKTTQRLESVFDYLYPGFSRGIDYKNGTYNQDLNPNMVLIEVGTNDNSFDEAMNSTEVIAKTIAKYLNSK